MLFHSCMRFCPQCTKDAENGNMEVESVINEFAAVAITAEPTFSPAANP